MARKTKAQKAKAAAQAHALAQELARKKRMVEMERDPNSLWNNDPVWNPKAEGYREVQQAFANGAKNWEDAMWMAEGLTPLAPEVDPAEQRTGVFGWFAEIFG